MDRSALTSLIMNRAMALGFSSVGIAKAGALEEEKGHLAEWLRHGYHATMKWMERDPGKRSDPGKVLDGARSVVSVAMNYYTPLAHSASSDAAKISRYAWGDDYHVVMTRRLERLCADIAAAEPSAHTRLYVDTGPILEKAWAQRAGIGWVGKHTNVITRHHGSWVFLGEILLDVELDADRPATDLCGTCTACIDACPTGAIVEPYVLDASRCISYLTIEHRGSLPPEWSGRLDGWVYGCDVCQDVCPWNRFQHATGESAFHPRSNSVNPSLEEIAALTPEEFSRRFSGSPVKRTKHAGIVRNANATLESRGAST